MTAHTPTPWTAYNDRHDGWRILTQKNPSGIDGTYTLARLGHVDDADAQLIVRAVNAHDDLVAACETALANLTPAYSSDHLVIRTLRAALAKASS